MDYKRLFAEESGQGMAEYGLILTLIIFALVVSLTGLKNSIENFFMELSDTLSGIL